MPKSKVRKKSDYTPPTRVVGTAAAKAAAPSPTWYPVLMAIVLVLGLAWIAVYYIDGEDVPVMQNIGAYNFAIGFGFMVVGLVMAVRWR
ncbi:MAG: cell division protein CrgA [Jatrophihabitans sp.]